MLRSSFALALGLLAGACAPTPNTRELSAQVHQLYLEQVRQSGKVLKEYDQDGVHYIVVETGPVIRKQGVSTHVVVAYEVDRNARICKSGTAVVDCASFRNDPDLAPYVTE